MEAKNIGIGEIIRAAHENPEQYSPLIGRRVARLIKKRIYDKERKGGSLEDAELLASAERRPSQKEIEKVSPLVTRLIKEHSTGTPEVGISDTFRALVARACMQLLGDYLHRSDLADLAHYIHDNPDIGIQFLNQPERLKLLEYGIIPDNALDNGKYSGKKNNIRYWSGHETQNSFPGRGSTHEGNIIVLLQKDERKKGGEITPVLRGQKIKVFGDSIVVFQNGTAFIHRKPNLGTECPNEFPLVGAFICDMDTAKTINHKKTITGWTVHHVIGTKKGRDGAIKDTEVVVCVNEQYPELSYSTNGKLYTINSNTFTIDTVRRQFVIHAKGEIRRVAFREILGILDLPNGEKYMEFSQRGLHMRLSFSGGKPIVSVERGGGWCEDENAIMVEKKESLILYEENEESL